MENAARLSEPGHREEGASLPSPEQQSSATVADAPKAGQTIFHRGKKYTTVKEGLAYILTPPDAPTSTDPKAAKDANAPTQSVFYNPIQQFNRDLSVLAIRAFGEDLMALKKRRQEKLDNARLKAKQRNSGAKRKHERIAGDASQSAAVDRQQGHKRAKEDGIGVSADQRKPAEGAAAEGMVQDTGNDASVDQDINDEDMLALESSLNPDGTSNRDTTGQQPSMTNDTAKPDHRAHNEPSFRVLDALSATGLRALRYAHELPFITSVTANDLSRKATELIALNAKHNCLEEKISPVTGNALAHMYSLTGQEAKGGPGDRYDVIDLDPYGTAAPFLDAAVQALNDGGLLCVTCTDSSVFASAGYPEKTFSQYGGLPLKGFHSHEGGLRLVLHAIATSAARYGIAIEPLLSLSIDYYIRLFVRIRRSPADVKFLAGKIMLAYNCDSGCGAWQTQFLARNSPQESKKGGTTYYKHGFAQAPTASPHCEHCGFKTHLSGPMYGGPMHNPAFIERILSYLPTLDKDTYGTTERIEGMLQTAYEETSTYGNNNSPASGQTNNHNKNSDANTSFIPRTDPAQLDHHPFYFSPSALAKVLHCQAPPEAALKGALRHAGFKATRSHTKPGTVRTDAPWAVIWEIMREWVRQKAPVREGAVREGMAGWRIMKGRLTKQDDDEDGGKAEGEGTGAEGMRENSEGAGTAGADADAGAAERARQGQDGSGRFGVVFDEQLGRDRSSKRLMRYQLNPRPNWGPMTRAK